MFMVDRSFWLGFFYCSRFFFGCFCFLISFYFCYLICFLFIYLFIVFSFYISLSLRPISVASKKSRIGLITFNILNSLFLDLSSLIFSRSIISRVRLL